MDRAEFERTFSLPFEEAAQWFRDKLGRMMTRDTLVDLGADVASMVIPGGSIAVKVINKLA